MADIVNSLFGIDPNQYAQQQQALQQSQAAQFAEMSGAQQGQYGAFRAGQQVAPAVATLLGGQDPVLQKATMAKQLAGRFNTTTSDGLRQYGQALAQNGAPDLAQMAIARADELDKNFATNALNTKKAMAEGTETEWIGVPGHPELKQQAIVDKITGKVTPVGAPISVYSQKTNITVDAKGETEFAKQLGKNDANTVTAAMTTRQNAVNTVQSLDKLAALDNSQLVTGAFASDRVGAANLLQTLGLASKEDAARIASSQQYQKVAKDTIFQTLGGKLGSGFSNDDRKFVEALIPQLETSPEARRQLINYMRKKNIDIIDETTRLETYARDKKGLGGFEYKLPRESIAPVAAGTSSSLLDEMKARGLIK